MSEASPVWVSSKTSTGKTVTLGGPDVDTMMQNAQRLGLDPQDVQALYLDAFSGAAEARAQPTPNEGQAVGNVQQQMNGQVVSQEPQDWTPAAQQQYQPQPQAQPQQQAAPAQQTQQGPPPPAGWYQGQQTQAPQQAPSNFGNGGAHPQCVHGPRRGPFSGPYGNFYPCALEKGHPEQCKNLKAENA